MWTTFEGDLNLDGTIDYANLQEITYGAPCVPARSQVTSGGTILQTNLYDSLGRIIETDIGSYVLTSTWSCP
jgi:hypothetical protein